MGKDSFQQYLTHYAEPEANLARAFIWPQHFHHTLVIPVYAEAFTFLQGLTRLCQNNRALIILIVNQPSTVSSCEANKSLWQFLLTNAELIHKHQHLCLFNYQGCYILAVDRFQENRALNPKHGVGLARKIGCDIAAALFHADSVAGEWIYTTDADATLPDDYFQRTTDCDASAAVYPFRHRDDSADAVTTATNVYEQSLRYYVNSLRWAGSPYAFHTVGSCLAFQAGDYCRVRGFPKRAGGEDFYLLNKLAKLRPVKSLPGKPIKIQSRRSMRAPFGTGQAVEKLLALDDLDDYLSYDPKVFVELKTLLKMLSNYRSIKGNESQWLNNLSAASRESCETLGINTLLLHLRKQARNREMAVRHIHHWFDGFRTLKFIHLLQGKHYPPIPFSQALKQAETLFNLEGG